MRNEVNGQQARHGHAKDMCKHTAGTSTASLGKRGVQRTWSELTIFSNQARVAFVRNMGTPTAATRATTASSKSLRFDPTLAPCWTACRFALGLSILRRYLRVVCACECRNGEADGVRAGGVHKTKW